MEDKDFKKLFSELKKSETTPVPDFDALLQRPRPILKKSSPLRSILVWFAAAASIAVIAFVSVWALNSNNPGDQLAKETLTEENNIMNWESKTDVLLPIEKIREEPSIDNNLQAPIVTKKTVLSEELKNLLNEVPELKAENYKYGSLSEWDSPTQDLMPFYPGEGFMAE